MSDDTQMSSPDWLDREEEVLAPYAMYTRHSRGKRYPEAEHPYRTLYQRDRDRIVHSTAFRRLMYKTQVLVNQVSDHHRTRLTHTLEVTQISRTIARQLRLNEDLTEAIALAHDLGHPPFGHAGEAALNECMREHGGFEHNLQGLRLLEELEYRYAGFSGLNLSYEVRQAQAMHSKRRDAPQVMEYLKDGQALLEAQVVDAADSLAYDTHDIDDALSIGLIETADLADLPFWKRALERAESKYGSLPTLQLQPTVIRALIDWQVCDLLEQTRLNLKQQRIGSVADVRGCAQEIVCPGHEVLALKAELEAFLYEKVYRHYRVMRMANKGQRILKTMFDEFCRAPQQLPTRYYKRSQQTSVPRTVCDYLAGMTDRYAQDEYNRLFQPYSM
jgi:dGTPase